MHIAQYLIKKSAQRDANTARWLHSKAGDKNFRPAADPLPGGTGRPRFNQLEMVTTFTYRPSLVKIDARNFHLSCTVTDTARPPATDRTDYNTLRCYA